MNVMELKSEPSAEVDSFSPRDWVSGGNAKESPKILAKTKPSRASLSKKLFVYLIDDDPHFRETFLDVMSLRGIEAKSASCGLEALKELQISRPAVIIVDVRLPDIHGFDLCRLIRRMDGFQTIPLVLLSASFRYNDPRDQVEGLLAGASIFLSKPITMENLWMEIDSLLKRGR